MQFAGRFPSDLAFSSATPAASVKVKDGMDQVNRVVTGGLNALQSLFRLVLAGFGGLEDWLRTQLTALGVSPRIETALLVAAAVALVLVALRAFGGLIRALLVLFFVLLLIHLLLPALHA